LEIALVIFLSTTKMIHQTILTKIAGDIAFIVIFLSKPNGSKNLLTICFHLGVVIKYDNI
jgi:hypothetical protein